ncbi:MAG TPA: tail fiber protein [Rhizomicrobium sp.]|nr:tail fiber protein [Rhizomicrobium sp.]
MSAPFVAEITIYPFNFAPKGWAFTAGQLLPISQNTALFSLLGTNYGGDGKSTFGLPNFGGAAPVGQGQGPGLSPYFVGETAGVPYVTLLQTEIPSHSHNFSANTSDGTVLTAANNMLSNAFTGSKTVNYVGNYMTTGNPATALSPTGVSFTGGTQPHDNMQPYLGLNFCIALQGVFPARP